MKHCVLAWVLVSLACHLQLAAQTTCRPPKDLRICQDEYGAQGRVFLVWTNGETSYTKVRVYLDGALAGEGPGNMRLGYLDELGPGQHTFAVEGVCADTSSTRAEKTFEVLAATPHAQPASAIDCQFDAAQNRLQATWTLGARPSIFIDVYVRRAGVLGLVYVTTLDGKATSTTVNGAQESDRLRLQFFDANCYGSELAGCPGPTCLPPSAFRVCQDLYGQQSRVFIDWVAGAADYSAWEVLVDGVKVATTAFLRTLHFVEPIAPGPHTFQVRGVCASGVAETEVRTLEVLTSSPHREPILNLHCQRDAAARTLTATWLVGAQPSEFADIYIRRPGSSLLDFAGTIAGDTTQITVGNVDADDQAVLQFFTSGCYGSPLISCGSEPGSRRFLRGDINGSARIDLSDAVFELRFLFLGGPEPLCLDAADANDNGHVDIADPIFVLNFLFGGGPAPPPPGPLTCGDDPTTDAFPLCLTAACP